jgi:phage baseplate assembly protein W
MPATRDLIGRGWRFPLGVDSRGGIALVEGDDEIREAILMIVRTRRGGRPMRPEFGCRVWDLLFAPNDVLTWAQAGEYVREALGWWEPRIDVDDVQAFADPDDPAIMQIQVDYTIRSTHDERSLVFPFYLIPGEERR